MKKIVLQPTGFFEVLATTKRSQVATMVLAPGKSTGGADNVHKNSDQWMYVLSGCAKVISKDQTIEVKTGELLLIEAGQTHEVINEGDTPLETFNIYALPEY